MILDFTASAAAQMCTQCIDSLSFVCKSRNTCFTLFVCPSFDLLFICKNELYVRAKGKKSWVKFHACVCMFGQWGWFCRRLFGPEEIDDGINRIKEMPAINTWDKRGHTLSLSLSHCAPSQAVFASLWTPEVTKKEGNAATTGWIYAEGTIRGLRVPVIPSGDKQPQSNILFHTHAW